MKTRSLIFILMFVMMNIAFSQETKQTALRVIEVCGTAERVLMPDEVLFEIGIQEYWKEEYEPGKTAKDFATKISLDQTEKELVGELSALGIAKDQMQVTEGVNFSKMNGKNFMSTRTVLLTLNDLKKVTELLQKIKTRGVSYMHINELRNKNLAQSIKQTKIEALKNAKEKAAYLTESMGATLGQVVTIVELETSANANLSAEEQHNRAVLSAANSSDISNRNIVLQYKIKASFEIK